MNELNNDLVKINNWAYQWKMSFDPDPNKQAQEVIFSRKTRKIDYLRKLQNILPRQALITIYKAFVRPHLAYGDILYNKA